MAPVKDKVKIDKTWLTTSRRPRHTHSKISGETIPVGQVFGNGLLYPGDGSQGPKENANCQCIMPMEANVKAEGGVTNRRLRAARTPEELQTLREANKVFDTNWEKKLTGDQEQAISDYMADPHVNFSLREGVIEGTDADQVGLMDAALTGTIQQDMMVYRGGVQGWIRKLDVGDTFDDKGYVSTSYLKSQADEFTDIARDTYGEAETIEVFLPKGSPGQYIARLNEFYTAQAEVLLPRGLKFRVIRKTGNRVVVVIDDVTVGGSYRQIGGAVVRKPPPIPKPPPVKPGLGISEGKPGSFRPSKIEIQGYSDARAGITADDVTEMLKFADEIANEFDKIGVPFRWNGQIVTGKAAGLKYPKGYNSLGESRGVAAAMHWDQVMSFATDYFKMAARTGARSMEARKVLLHEMSHAISPVNGYTYTQAIGMEEGLAECFARSLAVKLKIYKRFEQSSTYSNYVADWEDIRLLAKIPDSGRLEFYQSLLIKDSYDRLDYVLTLGKTDTARSQIEMILNRLSPQTRNKPYKTRREPQRFKMERRMTIHDDIMAVRTPNEARVMIEKVAEYLETDHADNSTVLEEAGMLHRIIEQIETAQMNKFVWQADDVTIVKPAPEKSMKRRWEQRAHEDVPFNWAITRRDVLDRSEWTCWLCEEAIEDKPWDDFDYNRYGTVDHVIPLSEGGAHEWDNVRAAHFECNSGRRRRQDQETNE